MVELTKSLVLVRHGATAWTATGRFCGWSDVPLSELGRRQALGVRDRIEQRSFAGVWTSDLTRAREFAELVRDGARSDPRLRELDFGEIEGKTWEECDPAIQAALASFDHFDAPGGESATGFRSRVVEFVDELSTGAHLVFTHGGVIRLLTRLSGEEQSPSPGEMVSLGWDQRK
ncbi:MAG TPA: histidine phosphatase family protein [Acidimicrobiia bacterium]|nr:histidine phosphatase family protein [Acidimicrobiia bacterium]